MRNTQHTSLECASIEIFFLMPGKFHGCRSLVGYSPWHHKESDKTEQLFTSLFTRVELLVLWGNPLYRDVHPYHPASREHAVDMDLDDMTEALSTMFLHYKLFLPFYSWLLGVVVEVLVVQSRLTLCDSMDCSPPDSIVCGIPRQEYWSGLPFPPRGDLLDPKMETKVSCRLPSEPLGKEVFICRPHLRSEELPWSTW